jgi:hypothetical protein
MLGILLIRFTHAQGKKQQRCPNSWILANKYAKLHYIHRWSGMSDTVA